MDSVLAKESLAVSTRNIMCRLCLSTNGVTEPIGYGDQYLIQKIYECTSIQITPLSGVSSVLCMICRARLEDFYQFRWQCIKNDEIIHRIAAGSNSKPLSSEGRVPSDLMNTTENDKRIYEQAPVHSGNFAELTCMTSHTDDKPLQHGIHPAGFNVHEAYSSFGSKYPNPTHVSPVVTDGQMAVRRKRGRPPKQQYDYGTHVVGKGQNPMVAEHSDRLHRHSESRWNITPGVPGNAPQIDQEPSGSSSENQDGQEWFKIKLEQTDQQADQHPTQNDSLKPNLMVNPLNRQYDVNQRVQSDSGSSEHSRQVLVSPLDSQMQPSFTQPSVKRSRGRPPREGGCPNEDREEYRFRCQYCSARFKAAINLKLHTNTHTGEKPYLCTICNKSFAHPSNLSVHMKLHNNPQPAGANGLLYCGSLKENGQQKHAPTSQQEKKFQCPYCQTLFALAFQLKIHINTHTGQKPYVCKNCGKGFAQPSNLHVHSKKHCRRKQVQFCETSAGERQSSGNFTPAVENAPTIHTTDTHGAGAPFGGISSYHPHGSSLSPMSRDSAAQTSHHNMHESHLNTHPAINASHAMLV